MFAIIDLEFTSWKGSLERDWKLSWEKRGNTNWCSKVQFFQRKFEI